METSADLCGTLADYNSIVNHNGTDRRIGKCFPLADRAGCVPSACVDIIL